MREGLFVFCFRRSLGWCNPLGHLRLQLRLQRPDWVPAMSQRTTTIATVQMWFAQVNWITETTESDAWTSPKSAIIFRLAHLCPCLMFLMPFPVCVYVNKHGDYGPHLDRKLVQQLPDHFGPAPVNAVLQQAVQACVDCTYQPSVLLSFLQSQSHTGGEVIRGKCGEHQRIFLKLMSPNCFFCPTNTANHRCSQYIPEVSVWQLVLAKK